MGIRHRAMGFLLALALILQMVPAMPLAVKAEDDEAVSRVIVDGEAIVSGRYMVSGTHQVRDTKPESGGYLYYEEGYLLLENYSFTSSSYDTINSEGALTIELVGENTLVGNYMYAIRHTTEEPLVIQGTGSLTASGRNGCISAYGDVTLNADISASTNASYASAIGCSGELYVEGGRVRAVNTAGLGISSNNLYMNGGIVEATGSTRGISTKILEINGGDLTAISTDTASDSQNYAIQVGQSLPEFYIHNNIGAHIAASTEPDGPVGTADLSEWKSYDYVRIYDAGVEVDGIRLSSGEYLSQGSDAPVTENPGGSYAHYAGGVLTLNDFVGSSIQGFGNLRLEPQGANRLNGQLTAASDITVSGTGSLEISVNSEASAVRVHNTLTVESGDLVISNAAGIGCEAENLHIDNGNVTINGGVVIYGMVINDGVCRITSDSARPAVEILPIDETSSASLSIYGGSLELSAAQTWALAGPLYMQGGQLLAETSAAGCRVLTDRFVQNNMDGYEYLCAAEPGGELVRCNENEMGQFSRICIRPHVCAPKLVEEVKPTCGDWGKLAYYSCSCGKYYEDAGATVRIPNIYEYGNLEPAGHDTDGVVYSYDEYDHYKICKVCGAMDLTTYGSHDFGEGLYCVCGATRQASLVGVITLKSAGSLTVRLWQGSVLLVEYDSYGSEHSFSAYHLKPGVYTLEVEAPGYEPYRAEITVDRLTVEHNVELTANTFTVTGTVKTYGDETDPVTLELLKDGKVVHTVTGVTGEFALEGVENGTYTLRITKENHTPLEQTVVIAEQPLELNLKICPVGDATGDGTVNIKDFQRMLKHINKTDPLEGYALACGDLTGDGECNIKDFQRLLRHINKTKPLY